ncbi:two-component regulator propeller domain-containing protein [Fulvivirgaceae bacterium BMA10]|uniref:Two-component regulator propeller domain-containing protein n=1 Tax=Splendidivirga corallicola TaxID=3051826 RepID=A0ABT8KJ36_9BACT|nr:two-component regulator propeller domain-containing protein [Fulvivirgaceae bacterium BMA10]
MWHRFIFLWFIFLLSTATPVIPQVKKIGLPSISNYGSQDYNSHPRNFSLIQANSGLIYVGNAYGVLEFDGNTWKKIELPNGLTAITLANGHNEEIYVGSVDELGRLVTDSQGQLYYSSLTHKIDTAYRQFGEVKSVLYSNEKTIFLTDHFLLTYTSEEFTVQRKTNETAFFQYIGAVHGRVYVKTIGGPLNILENEALSPLTWSVSLKDAKIVDILPCREDQELIVTQNSGLYLYNGSELISYPVPRPIATSEITCVFPLEGNFIALGTYQHGLFIVDQDGKLIQHIDKSKGLNSNRINALYKDRENNLWAALDNGVAHITLSNAFSFFREASGLLGMGYASLIKTSDIYLGSNLGLYHANRSNVNLEGFQFIEKAEGQVWNLFEINGNHFMGHERGVFKVEGGHVELLKATQNAWTFLKLEDRPHQFLVGTAQGILVFELTGSGWKFANKLTGFNEPSRIMAQDKDGVIWVCHGNKGLYKLTLSNDLQSTESIQFYGLEDERLPFYVSSVLDTEMGVLFTTSDGIARYNVENDTFELFDFVNRHLGNNKYVDKIFEDKDGNLWIIQEDNIRVLNPLDNGSYILLNENIIREMSGQLVGSYEHVNVYDRGNIFIGTQEGFAHLDLDYNISNRKEKQKHQFPSWIRKIESATNPDSAFFLGAINANMDRVVTLPYKLNGISIDYSAGLFQDHKSLSYQYAFDLQEQGSPQWSEWTNLTRKEYTNIREGAYIFRVRARDMFGNMSAIDTFDFKILPPWYRTKKAYIIYGTIILLALILLTLWIVQKFKLQKERLVEEKNKELLLKEKEVEEERIKADRERIKLINEKLAQQVAHKNTELATVAVQISQKNEFLYQLRKNLNALASHNEIQPTSIKKIIKVIDHDTRLDNNWERFQFHFDQVHQDFLKRLSAKFPALTKTSLKLCAFLRMDLSTKEIATLMNISTSGVEKRRYRLRKKLELDPEVNLVEFIKEI